MTTSTLRTTPFNDAPSPVSGVMVTVLGNGHGDTSSNPGRD